MGASISSIPDTLDEAMCKQLSGIRWENGLADIFATVEKNEDGTISKDKFIEYFQVDPWRVSCLCIDKRIYNSQDRIMDADLEKNQYPTKKMEAFE